VTAKKANFLLHLKGEKTIYAAWIKISHDYQGTIP